MHISNIITSSPIRKEVIVNKPWFGLLAVPAQREARLLDAFDES